MQPLSDHAAAWLSVHPERDRQWLTDRCSDGFDIHHIDGNHQNNDPANLVLIEHRDHQRLHAAPAIRYLRGPTAVPSAEKVAERQRAYELRASGMTWAEVAEVVCGRRIETASAMHKARQFAEATGAAWPIDLAA